MNQNHSQTKKIISIIGINNLPEIHANDNLGELIIQKSDMEGSKIKNCDILVVTQKLVSKSENRIIKLSTVIPSSKANSLSTKINRDPRLIELILQESTRIVAMDSTRGLIITETRHGFICANSGIDSSNISDEDEVSLLPIDPDSSADHIRNTIINKTPTLKNKQGNIEIFSVEIIVDLNVYEKENLINNKNFKELFEYKKSTDRFAFG